MKNATCDTCCFWHQTDGWFGQCIAIRTQYDDEESEIAYLVGSEKAEIYTAPIFGCVLHQKEITNASS